MTKIYEEIEKYYTSKILEYGPVPRGVDWNGEGSQMLRFKQLTKILVRQNFSVSDLGCGYGKLFEYLSDSFSNFNYIGYDLSKEMIDHAQNIMTEKISKVNNAQFEYIQDSHEIREADYTIASGIFSVKLLHNEQEWLSYILTTLELINAKSKKGFSFNMLTKYSDKGYMKEDLYYADPLFIFDYCKKHFSKNISLIHDYDLYEFTILVRKI